MSTMAAYATKQYCNHKS